MGSRTKKRLVLLLLIILVAVSEVILAIRTIWHVSWCTEIFSVAYSTIMFIIGVVSWMLVASHYWLGQYKCIDRMRFFTVLLVIIAIVLSSTGRILPFYVALVLNALLWIIFSIKFFFELVWNSRGDWSK